MRAKDPKTNVRVRQSPEFEKVSMTSNENSNCSVRDVDFWSSVIEIEVEYWENDVLGTKAVLMKLGCTAQQAEAAFESFSSRRSENKPTLLQDAS